MVIQLLLAKSVWFYPHLTLSFGLCSAFLALDKPCHDDRIVHFLIDLSFVFLIISEWFLNKNLFPCSWRSELLFYFYFSVWGLESNEIEINQNILLNTHLVQLVLLQSFIRDTGHFLLTFFQGCITLLSTLHFQNTVFFDI